MLRSSQFLRSPGPHRTHIGSKLDKSKTLADFLDRIPAEFNIPYDSVLLRLSAQISSLRDRILTGLNKFSTSSSVVLFVKPPTNSVDCPESLRLALAEGSDMRTVIPKPPCCLPCRDNALSADAYIIFNCQQKINSKNDVALVRTGESMVI